MDNFTTPENSQLKYRFQITWFERLGSWKYHTSTNSYDSVALASSRGKYYVKRNKRHKVEDYKVVVILNAQFKKPQPTQGELF